VLVVLAACGQSSQHGADGGTAATGEKVPVTTASEEARDLFMQGRELSDDLLIVEANDLFRQAVAVDDSFAMGHLMVAFTAQTNEEFFEAVGKASERAANASQGEQLTIAALVAASENDQAAQRDALQQAMEMYPQDERTHVGMANFLFGVQDFEGAAEHFEKAVAIAPDFASAHNALGYAYRNLEDFDSARKSFERYVELIPDQPNPYDSLAELLMEMGNYDESIENYRKALEINRYFPTSYAGLAINYSLKGNPELAQEAADQMLRAARNFVERQGAMFQSVTSHLYAGDIEAAMGMCDRMLAEAEVKGNHSAMGGTYEYMGDVMMSAGDAVKAVEYYDAALDHRLASRVNEANKAQAARAHLFKTAIAAMVGDESDAAASRTAEYLVATDAKGTAFERLRGHELSGFFAMYNEDYESAATHFAAASQLNPVVLYWSAVVNQELGNTDQAQNLAMRAATRNTLSPNLPFFRDAALEMLANS
jgi:tetratricopeptide (TPR) repeat protein